MKTRRISVIKGTHPSPEYQRCLGRSTHAGKMADLIDETMNEIRRNWNITLQDEVQLNMILMFMCSVD